MNSAVEADPKVKYVITEDSDPVNEISVKKQVVRVAMFVTVLSAIIIVSVYSLGVGTITVEDIAESPELMKLDAAEDALCLSYNTVVNSCTDVTVDEIAENGCMSYVEADGGICVCLDETETSCVVNDDCNAVDTSGLTTTQLDDATDALCESYSILVEACELVSVEEIAENGCMSYFQPDGGICVCYDDSETLCIVNSDC